MEILPLHVNDVRVLEIYESIDCLVVNNQLLYIVRKRLAITMSSPPATVPASYQRPAYISCGPINTVSHLLCAARPTSVL